MNLKNEKALDQAVTQTNATRWEKIKKFSRKTLLATISTISIATGMLGSSQQMSAQAPQNYVTVNADNLDAYLNGNRSQTATRRNQQQYAQVYANRDAYRQQQSHQKGVSVEGEYAYENDKTYRWSAEFNQNRGNYLNDRAIIGIYEEINGLNDYILVTAPIDQYGHIIYDGRLTATHFDYANLRTAQQQGTCGFNRSDYRGGYYSHPGTRTGRVIRDAVHIGHTMYHIINGHRHR